MNLKVIRISNCGSGYRPNLRLAPAERTDEKAQAQNAKTEEKCEDDGALCVNSVNPEIQADMTGDKGNKPETMETEQIDLKTDEPDFQTENESQQLEKL